MKRFDNLDALRGVAAISVMAMHSQARFLVPNASYAVDMFFVLSGFVIAGAYERRLPAMGVREFMLRRLVRLYPMILMGGALGVALQIARHASGADRAQSAAEIAVNGVLTLLCLPNPASPLLFPYNVPMWSLFFELVTNLLYAVFAARLTSFILAVVVAAASIYLTATGTAGMEQAFPRAVCGFSLGVLLFRHPLPFRIPFPMAAAILVAVFANPLVYVGWLFVPTMAILAVVVGGSVSHSGSRAYGILGQLSYPLYLIHWPVLFVVDYFIRTKAAAAFVTVVPLLLLPAAAYALSVLYESPAIAALKRAWLSGPDRGHPL